MRPIGRVEALWRHPVKGMRGERVERSTLRWAGLAGDRRYAFVRGDDDSRFPWFTGRVRAELLLYRPRFLRPEDPNTSPVVVQTPSGIERPVEDPALTAELAALYGAPLHLLHSGRGLHDASPVSLIGRPTIDALCGAQQVRSEPRRFRNNLVVVGARGEPFEEEAWLGQTLQVGEGPDAPRLRLDRKNERCVVITLEPETLERTPGLLRALAQDRQGCAGIYASVVRPGELVEGAELFALDAAQ